MDFIFIYITYEKEIDAQIICEQLIKEKLIACANIHKIQSMYQWEGEVVKAEEWVSILKTSNLKWEIVRDRVEEIHPYDIPCVSKLNVDSNGNYAKWINEVTLSL